MFSGSSYNIICNSDIKIAGFVSKNINVVILIFRMLLRELPRLVRLARDDITKICVDRGRGGGNCVRGVRVGVLSWHLRRITLIN